MKVCARLRVYCLSPHCCAHSEQPTGAAHGIHSLDRTRTGVHSHTRTYAIPEIRHKSKPNRANLCICGASRLSDFFELLLKKVDSIFLDYFRSFLHFYFSFRSIFLLGLSRIDHQYWFSLSTREKAASYSSVITISRICTIIFEIFTFVNCWTTISELNTFGLPQSGFIQN